VNVSVRRLLSRVYATDCSCLKHTLQVSHLETKFRCSGFLPPDVTVEVSPSVSHSYRSRCKFGVAVKEVGMPSRRKARSHTATGFDKAPTRLMRRWMGRASYAM
jgi:hypothetical protein